MARGLVMAFGVFDVLHLGHLRFLTAARRLGNELIVVVTRDVMAEKSKGRRPVMHERERLTMVQALKVVDRAVLGDRGAPSVIKKYHPAVIAVGYDQNEQHPQLLLQVRTIKKQPIVVKIKAYQAKRYHSSILKKRPLIFTS